MPLTPKQKSKVLHHLKVKKFETSKNYLDRYVYRGVEFKPSYPGDEETNWKVTPIIEGGTNPGETIEALSEDGIIFLEIDFEEHEDLPALMDALEVFSKITHKLEIESYRDRHTFKAEVSIQILQTSVEKKLFQKYPDGTTRHHTSYRYLEAWTWIQERDYMTKEAAPGIYTPWTFHEKLLSGHQEGPHIASWVTDEVIHHLFNYGDDNNPDKHIRDEDLPGYHELDNMMFMRMLYAWCLEQGMEPERLDF